MHLDMGLGLEREGPLLGFNFGAGERSLDIKRPRVVPLDEVRVVAVHHTDEIGEFGQTVLVQPLPDVRRLLLDFDCKIGQDARYLLFEEAGLDTGGCPGGFHADLSLRNSLSYHIFMKFSRGILPILLADPYQIPACQKCRILPISRAEIVETCQHPQRNDGQILPTRCRSAFGAMTPTKPDYDARQTAQDRRACLAGFRVLFAVETDARHNMASDAACSSGGG